MSNFFKIDLGNRIFGLDILRFSSIFWVVYAHAYPLLDDKVSPQAYHTFSVVNDAVSIFFVLSGYLIGNILVKLYFDQGISPKNIWNFWLRRWFRTLPAYWATIILLLLVSSLKFGSVGAFSWKYFFFLQNFKTRIPGFFVESWSLTIEEWFYLLVPIVLLVVFKFTKFDKRKQFLFVLALFIVLPLLYRLRRSLMLNSVHPDDLPLFTQQVLTRIDSIVFGVLGAFIKRFYVNFWAKAKYWGIALTIGIHLVLRQTHFHWFGTYAQVFSASVESFQILCVFPFFSTIKNGKGFISKTITFVSIISYSLYLLNLSFVLETIMPFLEKRFTVLKTVFWLDYLFYFVINISLAYLLYIIVERPMMNLREKFSTKDH
jgi:peptidoglycan/LPS O-acetylase OafA/YrhL